MSDTQGTLPWWRRVLVDAGLIYLGWVVPSDRPFKIEYEPLEKPWSLQVLEEDAKPKALGSDPPHRPSQQDVIPPIHSKQGEPSGRNVVR